MHESTSEYANTVYLQLSQLLFTCTRTILALEIAVHHSGVQVVHGISDIDGELQQLQSTESSQLPFSHCDHKAVRNGRAHQYCLVPAL